MSPYLCTVQIELIVFESYSSDVMLKVCRLNDGSLCDLFISFSELNVLLTRLLENNPNVFLEELFEELFVSDSFSQFVLDASNKLKHRDVNLSFLSHNEEKKWIRA